MTPLNTNVTEIFMEIRRDPNFKWPTRMRTPPQRHNNQKFCEYHKDHGHLTEDCISLGHEIENFIKNRKLVRGIAGRGKSNFVRKAHASKVNVEEVFLLKRPSKAQKKDSMILSFSEEDAKGVSMPHNDALVVTMKVANHAIHRILVDTGNSTDILYWPVFKHMRIDWERIKPFGSLLVGFAGEQVQPLGLISLSVIAGTVSKQSTVMVDFLVVDRPSAYNAIISRLTLNKLMVATSTYHLKMKFLTDEGVGKGKGDQVAARKCYNTSLKKPSGSAPLTISNVGSRKEGEPAEALVDVVVEEDKVVKIGS
ncbi:uncharacterized protein LOC132162917 [Corylus avellana]|uniref:uncharacterized protein LOC132162917 n=1 Tax=Corylus avellana TaxID=13451 RepID=UPI00286C5F30|nr:uncharacterized protein LOC132162917 [Corylus avellana]